MSTADRVAIVVFLGLLVLGLCVAVLKRLLRQRPKQRARARLIALTRGEHPYARSQGVDDASRARREARHRHRRQSLGRLGHYVARIEVVAGRRGLVTLIAVVASTLLATAVAAGLFLPLAWWSKLLLVGALPSMAAMAVYGHQEHKFRLAFLAQLPDILDMIIRASHAGVPVTQSLRDVGQAFAWPAGPEFRLIGDSLHLGNDMTVVLDEAERRIRLPDFSFLTVCLLLQRETGGSLSATLSNLASVIRSRRDLRLKTRALTAEGRLSGTVISIIPIFILGVLWIVNPNYIAILFNTETGRTLLMVAAGMLVAGILAMRKIAKLEV
jgi:Flp pilus assembly protein TadB